MNMATITIRASSLDDAADCPRRHALRMFRDIQAKHSPRPLRPAIGGLVGTGVHAAAYLMWEGENLDTAKRAAIGGLESAVINGVTLDIITPSIAVAKLQLIRCTNTYASRVMPRLEPILVEQHLEATIQPGVVLSGHPDMVTADHVLRDIKDEIRSRPHINQLGGYALLLRSHGHRVDRIVIDHIKRQSERAMRTKPPYYAEMEYPVALCETSAHDVVTRTVRSLAEYSQRELDKDPRAYLAFRANPSSVLCSEKYCPAWGTRWCQEGSAAHSSKSVSSES